MQRENTNPARETAEALDRADPLRAFRDAFFDCDDRLVYLDGNSLGRLPLNTAARMKEVVTGEWGTDLIRGWNAHWYRQPREIGDRIARLIGAQPGEVVLADSTTVNLYKLLYAAVVLRSPRSEIVSDTMNFPSDLYVMQGIAGQLGGLDVRCIESRDGVTVEDADIEAALSPQTAVLSLSHASFRSAFLYDMKRVTRMAHDAGALALWDLSHSVGAVPIDLHGAGADLAVGCTYKYLNGGPGAPAFLYVRKDLQDMLHSPIQGWFGDSDPFSFKQAFDPAPGIGRFLVGTPPVLSVAAVGSGLDIVEQAGIPAIREKSVRLCEYLMALADEHLAEFGCRVASPRDAGSRGSHVAVAHPEAYRICQALISPDVGEYVVIPDFRAPDIVRLGLSPLTTSFGDVRIAVTEMRHILRDGHFRRFPADPDGVT